MAVPSNPDLKWPRPTGWDTWPVFNVTGTAHQVISGNGGNLRVQLPEDRIAAPITVENCTNVVIIGGQINALPTATVDGYDQRMIYFRNISNIVHIEGVHLNGAITGAETDGIAGNGATTSVRIQNCRVVGLRGGASPRNHADCFQTWTGVKEMLFYNFTGDSNYQGIKFELTNSHIIDRGIFERVNLRGNDYTPTYQGGYLFWLDPPGLFPITITDFYVKPRGTRPLGQSVWPGETNATNPIQITAGSPNTGRWPSGAKVSGIVVEGNPPTGDFAPDATTGLNYFVADAGGGSTTGKAQVAGTAVGESTASTSVTCAVPTGTVAGDYLVAHISHDDDVAPPAQAGWTAGPNAGTGTINVSVYGRRATSNEPASYTFTGLLSGEHTASITRVTGVDATTPVDVTGAAVTTGVAAESIPLPSATTTKENTLVLYGIGAQTTSVDRTFIGPVGTTQIAQSTGSGRRQVVFAETIATAGATGTRTFTCSASLPLAGTTTYLRSAAVVDGGGTAAPVPVPAMSQPVVGIPTSTVGRVTAKIANSTSVRLKVGTDSAVTLGVVYGAAATPDAEGFAEMSVSGLDPRTSYYYRVEMTDANGLKHLDTGTVGRFRTAPTPMAPSSFKIAFSACCRQADSASMSTIADRRPDIFFHLGDLYYADGTGTGLANFKAKFDAKINASSHAKLFRSIPTGYIPSDHDGMADDSYWELSNTAWTNWNAVYRSRFTNTGLPGTEGVYKSVEWGRVLFILLDTRSFKSGSTALGSTQKQWMKDQITNSPQPVIVIVQDGPWTEPTEAGGDSWNGFNTERQELGNFFAASSKKIIMLGGDQHAISADDGRNTAGGIVAFQAAPLNNTSSHKGTWSVAPYPTTTGTSVQQFGEVNFTDDGTTITAAFAGYSSDGTVRRTLSTSWTGPPAGEPLNPEVVSHTATHTANGMTLTARLSDVPGPVTLRAGSSPLDTRAAFHAVATPDANGDVSMAITQFTDATTSRYWQLELGDNGATPGTTILVSGQLIPVVAGSTSGGAGGSFTDQLNLTHTGAGYSASYHLMAGGLDPTKPIGMLLYIDGTGEYGIKNPDENYLMAGANGIVAVAKRHNMLLLLPFSPDRVNESWHYNDPIGYTAYLETLIRDIYSKYNIDKTRFVGAGYSSGAQVMSRYLIPQVLTTTTPPIALDGLMLMISFGGAPHPAMGTTNPEPKLNMHLHWNVGDADDQGGYDGTYGALVGEDYYRTNGWATSINVIPGGTHSRSDFGLVAERAMLTHVGPVAEITANTASRTTTGMTWTGDVAGTSQVVIRASANPITTQTGFYKVVDVVGGKVSTSFTTFTAGTPYYWQVEAANPDPTVPGGMVLLSGQVPGVPPTTGGGGGEPTTRVLGSYPFNGTDGSAWSADWTTVTSNGGVVDQQTGLGRLYSTAAAYGSGNLARLTGLTPRRDWDVTLDLGFFTIASYFWRLNLRATGGSTTALPDSGYSLRVNPRDGLFEINRLSTGGSQTLITSFTTSAFVSNVGKRVRFAVEGNTIRVKVWDPAAAEPTDWSATVTDDTYSQFIGEVSTSVLTGPDAVSRSAFLDNIVVSGGEVSAVTFRTIEKWTGVSMARVSQKVWNGSALVDVDERE